MERSYTADKINMKMKTAQLPTINHSIQDVRDRVSANNVTCLHPMWNLPEPAVGPGAQRLEDQLAPESHQCDRFTVIRSVNVLNVPSRASLQTAWKLPSAAATRPM